jgi:peptidyl-prolyl cis-trans isomerase D
MENIMLDTLKNKINSIFSKIFLLILAASFALWGVGDIFSSRNNPGVAAVGKLDVTANEFIETYQRILTELNKNTDGQITEEVAQSLGLPRQTLSQLINEKIIDIEVEKANITVPDDHLKKLIYSSSLFKDQFGAFSKQQFEYVLRQLGMDQKTYFNEIKKSILRDQIRSPFTYANDISPVIKETYYNIRNENRSIKVINIVASNYKINEIPKDTEIQNKLNKDQQMYMNQELRSFSFISLKPADLIDTIKISEEDLKDEYNNYPEKYNTSEKRNVLLVNFQDEEEAIKIIEAINQLPQETSLSERLLNVLEKSPTQDHEEAKLGIIEYKDLPNEVSENVFKARENKLIGPEKTPFGWRIFLVNQIIPKVVKKYSDVKLEIEKELKVNVALEKMYNLGNAFYDEIAAGNGIQDAAIAINAKVLRFNNIDTNGIDAKGNVLSELPPYPNLMQTVFSANINEPSELINTIGNTIYAIQVENIIPQSTMTFDEAKEKIIKDIQKEKSLNIALNIANEIIKKQNNKQDFESLAKEYNLVLLNADSVQKDGSGAEGILNDEALNQIFNIKNGKTTNPIKYNDNTYIIAKVEDIIPVTEINKEKLLELNLTISKEIANDIQELFIKNLTSKQKIKINDTLLNSLFQNNS